MDNSSMGCRTQKKIRFFIFFVKCIDIIQTECYYKTVRRLGDEVQVI